MTSPCLWRRRPFPALLLPAPSVQVLGSGRRQYRWRQQNSTKIISDRFATNCIGLLQYDSKTGARRHRQPSALRRSAHQDLLTISTRLTSWPATCLPTSPSISPSSRCEARQCVPDQLPSGMTRSSATILDAASSVTSPRTISRSTPSTPSTWPSRSAYGQAYQHHSAVRLLL